MSSPAQITANQANALHSTGPKTDVGKEHSSHNALKHGLTASTVLIPGEDPAEYNTFRQGLTASWSPVGDREVAFVDELISIQWRLKRCERLEAVILSAESPDWKALNNISLHAARLKRQFTATIHELCEFQNARLKKRQEEMQIADTLRRADIAQRRRTDFSQFGFDFTVEEIDRRILNQDALQKAVEIASHPGFRQAA